MTDFGNRKGTGTQITTPIRLAFCNDIDQNYIKICLPRYGSEEYYFAPI